MENKDYILVGMYVDIASGLKKKGRVQFEKMLKDCKRKRVDLIVTKSISRFALGGKRCRHNMKYWTDAPYFGFGAAAHSYDGVQRTANTSDRKKYIKGERVEMRSVLTRDDKTEERIMLSLRTADGLDLKKFFSDFGYSLEAAKEKRLSELVKSGMVEIGNGCLRLTEKAYYVMNGIIVSLI